MNWRVPALRIYPRFFLESSQDLGTPTFKRPAKEVQRRKRLSAMEKDYTIKIVPSYSLPIWSVKLEISCIKTATAQIRNKLRVSLCMSCDENFFYLQIKSLQTLDVDSFALKWWLEHYWADFSEAYSSCPSSDFLVLGRHDTNSNYVRVLMEFWRWCRSTARHGSCFRGVSHNDAARAWSWCDVTTWRLIFDQKRYVP